HRFTIGRGLLVIAACGLGLAALKGDTLWFSGVFTLTIVGLLVAALGAMFRRGPARAFFAGAVVFGCAYLWLLSANSTFDLLVAAKSTCALLLTDRFLRFAAEWAYFRWPSPPSITAPVAARIDYGKFLDNYLVNWNGVEPRSVFAGVGHLIFAWLFALGGGLV